MVIIINSNFIIQSYLWSFYAFPWIICYWYFNLVTVFYTPENKNILELTIYIGIIMCRGKTSKYKNNNRKTQWQISCNILFWYRFLVIGNSNTYFNEIFAVHSFKYIVDILVWLVGMCIQCFCNYFVLFIISSNVTKTKIILLHSLPLKSTSRKTQRRHKIVKYLSIGSTSALP